MIVEILIVMAIFIGLALARAPIGVALGVGALIGMLIIDVAPVNALLVMYRGLDVFVVLAIPFFLAVGFLAYKTSIGDRLVDVSAVLTGGARGGLGHINVVLSMLFAGLSGSATADASGEGAWMIPAMKSRGYSPEYAAALTAITSVIGVIIPPSLMMIIYAAFAGVSVGALFAAGLVPGVMVGVVYLVINYLYARRHDIDKGIGFDSAAIGADTKDIEAELPAATIPKDEAPVGTLEPRDVEVAPRSKTRILLRAIPAMGIPAVLLGGTVLGFFTATEAGAVALAYILVLTMGFYRELSLRRLFRTLDESYRFYALPLFAAGAATVFGFVITYMRAPDLIRDVVEQSNLSAWGFLILVSAVFLFIGGFLDAFPAIILFAPIFVPSAVAVGVHPITLGIVVVMTLALGLVTPPYGICLFITAKLAECSTGKVARALFPFYIVTLAVVAVGIFAPDVFLFVPRLLYPALF